MAEEAVPYFLPLCRLHPVASPGLSLTSGGPCSAFLVISNAYFFHSPHHYSSSLACSPLYPVYHPPMPILSLSHAHVITLLCPLYHPPIPTISPYKAAKNTRKTNYKVIVKSHVIPPPPPRQRVSTLSTSRVQTATSSKHLHWPRSNHKHSAKEM